MNKDFPLLLFPLLNEEIPEDEYISDMHKNAEKLLKLNLRQPIDANFNDETREINCLTHKIFSDSIINCKSSLLPWNLPNNFHNIGKYNHIN